MQPKEPIINEELQQQFFGKRFRGATKARVSFPPESSEQIAKWLEKPKNFMMFMGPPGIGKTYILSAIVGECSKQFPFMRAFNEREYMGKMREGIQKYTNYDFIKEIYRLTDNDLFILDDMGSASRTDWRDDIIMETLDWCYNQEKSVILTTNFTKDEFWKNYHPRICSRIFAKENTIVNLEDMPDLRAEGK